MYTISQGDEYEHKEYGAITVEELEETLDEGYITQTSEGLVFDGASVVETRVLFHINSDNRVGNQEIMEFCEDIDLGEE